MKHYTAKVYGLMYVMFLSVCRSVRLSRCVALWASTITSSSDGASSISSSPSSILFPGANVQSGGTGHLPVSDAMLDLAVFIPFLSRGQTVLTAPSEVYS